MSAVRHGDRRAARNQLSSPYKRPNAKPKKSSWSLSSLFSYLNPLRRTKSSEELKDGPSDEDDEKESSDGSEHGESRPADLLSQRGRELAQQPQLPRLPQSPLTPTRQPQSAASTLPVSSLVSESAEMISPFKPSTPFESPRLNVPSQSPAEKLETVKQYLRDRSDQPLHHVEYVGLVSLLKDSVQDDDEQPFRFSTSPTPSRGTTPFNLRSPTPSSQQTPRRTLTRNPNGVYKWQGAGSARPRNRHQSPAFGPPRLTPSKIKLSAPEASPHKTENKRRRVDTAVEPHTPHATGESLPLAQPREQTRAEPSTLSSSSGSSSSTSMNDSSPDKSTSTPRLHLTVPPKPTTPAVPSPLRHTWGVGDSSSSHSPPSSKPSQPTRAANFMAELIKEVTPPKKPDLSNPYQTASPVKPSLQKKPPKKRKAPEEPPTEQENKDVNLSHQTIVEATVPKGTQRSRPPPNIGKGSQSKVNGVSHPEPPRRSARLKSPSPPRVNVVHAVTNGQGNEESRPSLKRQKVPPPTVEEVPDVDMHSPTSPTITHLGDDSSESPPNAKKTTPTTNGSSGGATPKPPFPLKSSAPKEPSKLRFGFAAESDPDSPPPAKPAFDRSAPAPAQPYEPLSTLPAVKPQPPAIQSRIAPEPSTEVASPSVASSSTESQSVKSVLKGAKEAALAVSKASLPSFSFDVPTETSSKHEKERSEASTAEPSSLLVFSFTFGTTSTIPTVFNWEAAGIKPPTKATGSWTCGTCMVSNDAAKTKCVACEEPRPNSTTNGAILPTEPPKPAAAPTSGFNWAAAGMKAPTKAPETWSCQVCMVDNDAAQVKCASCEEPKRDLSLAAPEPAKQATPSGGFNWAAAGLKMPTKAPGAWTCKVCMVDNDPTKAKCVSCEEPRA